MPCCPPRGAEPFTVKVAERDARRLRRRGLGAAELELADAVEVEGRTVLEVGGGVGGLHLELLRRGAARATNVELSPAYEHVAGELARERHVEGRVERRVLDFARDGAEVEAADVVVLHRVVCCSPDVDGLVGGSAAHAREALALSFPIDAWWTRAVARVLNTGALVIGWQWRFYVHREAAIVAAAEHEGLRRGPTTRKRIWRLAVFVR